MIGITPKQMSLRTTIDEFIKQHGYSPSVAELAVLQGTVKSNIVRMINDLERRGHVKRMFGRPRSVTVVPIGEQQ
tara:strand:+ start:323 stop:547 length:225 start_codon:yes stop_codon:yes gene_type:complete